MIKSFEVVCKPCLKCMLLEEKIKTIMKCLEFKYSIKVKYEFKRSRDITRAEKLGYNISQLPLLLINDQVEFVGKIKGENVIRMKLESLLLERGPSL